MSGAKGLVIPPRPAKKPMGPPISLAECAERHKESLFSGEETGVALSTR
jgi:hypothetical protein